MLLTFIISIQRKSADDSGDRQLKKPRTVKTAPPAKVQGSHKAEPGPVVKTSKKKTASSSIRKYEGEIVPHVVYPPELGYTNGGKKVGALCTWYHSIH